MKLTLGIIFLTLLLFNSYQDFKSRSIFWINIPVLVALFLAVNYLYDIYVPSLTEIYIGISIIFFQVIFVSLFFYLKYRKLNILDKMIGIADVVFLLLLAFVFSPVNLIAFELLLFLTSLVVSFLIKQAKSQSDTTIPLAGNLTLALAVLFLFEYITGITIRNSEVFEFALQII